MLTERGQARQRQHSPTWRHQARRAPESRRGAAQCAPALAPTVGESLVSSRFQSFLEITSVTDPGMKEASLPSDASVDLSPPPDISGFGPALQSYGRSRASNPSLRDLDSVDARVSSPYPSSLLALTPITSTGAAELDLDELPPPVVFASDKNVRRNMPAREPDSVQHLHDAVDGADARRVQPARDAHESAGAGETKGSSAARRPSSASFDVPTPLMQPGICRFLFRKFLRGHLYHPEHWLWLVMTSTRARCDDCSRHARRCAPARSLARRRLAAGCTRPAPTSQLCSAWSSGHRTTGPSCILSLVPCSRVGLQLLRV